MANLINRKNNYLNENSRDVDSFTETIGTLVIK